MAEITAAMVKQLRDKTSAGMMECKKALVEANGDIEQAEIILRKRGIASAGKKSARVTKQGVIGTYIQPDSKLGVMVEVNCESDFVARTDEFQELVKSVATQLASQGAADVEALMSQPTSDDQSQTIADVIKSKIAKLGENIAITRFVRMDLAGQQGAIGSYLHQGAQLGVMVELVATSEAIAENPEVAELVKDLAMQVAAADPQFIRREDVTPEAIAKEQDIARDRARAEGKPDKILDKIVEGRLSKFYEEVCLLEQPFIKDNTQTIADLIKSKTGKLGCAVSIARFVRMKVGDSAPLEEQAAAE